MDEESILHKQPLDEESLLYMYKQSWITAKLGEDSILQEQLTTVKMDEESILQAIIDSSENG